MMIRRLPIRVLAVAALAAAWLAGPVASWRAKAADLAYHAAERIYVSPSPCALYETSFRESLASMRATARLFRAQLRRFQQLKRSRQNNGLYGPDIALNAVMSAEQIDIANRAAQVTMMVEQARRLDCRAKARQNAADNEAFRLDREVAQEAIWIDPRTFW